MIYIHIEYILDYVDDNDNNIQHVPDVHKNIRQRLDID